MLGEQVERERVLLGYARGDIDEVLVCVCVCVCVRERERERPGARPPFALPVAARGPGP